MSSHNCQGNFLRGLHGISLQSWALLLTFGVSATVLMAFLIEAYTTESTDFHIHLEDIRKTKSGYLVRQRESDLWILLFCLPIYREGSGSSAERYFTPGRELHGLIKGLHPLKSSFVICILVLG